MPPGQTDEDVLGYAYDPGIDPRPYQPPLAYTLAQLAARGAVQQATVENAPPPPEHELVLVHPADEVARVACRAIARQLSAIGLPCTARPLPPGMSRPDNEDWDLLYLEAHIAEPLIDAHRLLGPAGVLKSGSAYLNRKLQLLAEATSWKDARDRLFQLHRGPRGGNGSASVAVGGLSCVPPWPAGHRAETRVALCPRRSLAAGCGPTFPAGGGGGKTMTDHAAVAAGVTRPAVVKRNGGLRWFWLVLCAAACSTRPAWSQATWDASPYRVRVWVALQPVPELTDAWTHHQSEVFRQAVRRDVGVAWQLQLESAPAALDHAIDGRMDRLTAEAVLAHDARVDQLDKLFLLAVTCRWDEISIQVRELDCQTRIWGPLLQRELVQSTRLGLEAARAVIDSFAPVVRIDKVEGATIAVRPRASYLIGSDNPRLTVAPGDLLRPVVRRDDRFGNPTSGGIEALAWTVLEVMPAAANATDRDLVSCRLHTGVAQLPLTAQPIRSGSWHSASDSRQCRRSCAW